MFKFYKSFKFIIFFALALLVFGVFLHSGFKGQKLNHGEFSSTESEMDFDGYYKNIQPIFNNRCATCHTCLNSKCQLNLGSYEGLLRGANKLPVYNFKRLSEADPTRIFIDAHSPAEWQKKGFHPVLDSESTNPEASIIYRMIHFREKESAGEPKQTVEESLTCPADIKEQESYESAKSLAGMPYGLPPLSASESDTIKSWIENGALGPTDEEVKIRERVDPRLAPQIRDWEVFLNQDSDKARLVSRYLYDHWFLAHFDFPEKQNEFYKLVRSRTSCDKKIDIIPSRRPNDDPGVPKFYYCFSKISDLIVDKTHLVYPLSNQKMQRLRELFYTKDWSVQKLPSYSVEAAGNPFVTFEDIPVRARYQFLLDDARYHINTFIKGPVCFGNNALNSIDEKFYVLFLDPKSDSSVVNPGYERKISKQLQLPLIWGSNVSALDVPKIYFKDLLKSRNQYRQMRALAFKKMRPQGYGINDLWNGDGNNDNAILTVMRHRDSAVVDKGARGDLSKTAFVLDYPLFERLCYDLVVGYDVFGNVGHQLLSRVYMDFIRMEAEENYLLFMPAAQRKLLRNYWYRGKWTQEQLKKIFPLPMFDSQIDTQMKYQNPKKAQAEFIEDVLFSYLSPQVRGPIDTINWKSFNAPAQIVQGLQIDSKTQSINNQLKKLAAVPGGVAPFSTYFPNLSFLRVRSADGEDLAYSILHHKEHLNIAWIFFENERRDQSIDSLTILPGFEGSYPNYFFLVDQDQLENFVNEVYAVKTDEQFAAVLKKWGIARSNPDFWSHFDWFNKKANELNPVDSGLFDLTRYDIF